MPFKIFRDKKISNKKEYIRRVRIRHRIEIDELHYRHQVQLTEMKHKHAIELKKLLNIQEIELIEGAME